MEGVALSDDPLLFLALVQTRFATGTHDLYQLPIVLHSRVEEGRVVDAIAQAGEWTATDALGKTRQPARLAAVEREQPELRLLRSR